jgi:hypothetical protein
MINEITRAMVAAIGLRTLARVILAYPTQAEAIRKAADAYTRTRLTPTIIDQTGGEGSALGWIDGLKQAIDTVPLLKSAMPPPKPDPGKPPPEEKTLEELVTVIPGRGQRSNLQGMKDLLEAALKLRSELARAIGAGRSCESILSSSALGPVRSLGNFESFAAQLFDDLAAQRAK